MPSVKSVAVGRIEYKRFDAVVAYGAPSEFGRMISSGMSFINQTRSTRC